MASISASAIDRLPCGEWSGAGVGRNDSPYPGRSAATTVWPAVKAGATACHINCDCG
jgi:hypothetical protein